ncbi:LppP/LprE family lipoprotein [Alicyclobacillus tolerans]|uniref:LppP/LprE family lipoprotein n=1 Tax=Alicyclobacillus tolerans TaxID=90970 RepID=UPI001F356A52|nr:LppP/LprE family lipoprotein [Alicyclobacillus tolerans]MCF8568129.1 LppP/LprE family lipoprotein [Alicyclobacillus tolerans]
MNKRLTFIPMTAFVLLTLAGCGSTPNASGVNNNQVTNSTTNTLDTSAVSGSTGATNKTASNTGNATTGNTANSAPTDSTTTSQSDYASQITLIKNKGYSVDETTPNATVKNASGDTLTAWITTDRQSQDGYNHLVFFFLNGQYLGTDTAKPSLEITSAKAAGNGIAVTYPVYMSNDSFADPTGTPVTITYTLNGSKLVANKPYPKQFQGSNSTSQGQNSIATTSYSTAAKAANEILSIQGVNGVGAGATVNLGNGIIAKESAGMGQARYVWQEGNWTIQIRFYTRNSSTVVKQVAKNMVTYLHTHMLPTPNSDGVIVVESTDANTTSFQPKTTMAWQEGTKVNELQQTGNPIQTLQTVVDNK